jgi:uncharacterized protein YjbJ (UPF0337 family)
MNTETIKSNWNQLKGDLKSKWGQITDEEWMQIAGDRDKLIGRIQAKYGRTRDEVSREVDEFFRRHDTSRVSPTGYNTGETAQHNKQSNPNDSRRKIS